MTNIFNVANGVASVGGMEVTGYRDLQDAKLRQIPAIEAVRVVSGKFNIVSEGGKQLTVSELLTGKAGPTDVLTVNPNGAGLDVTKYSRGQNPQKSVIPFQPV